MNQALKDVFKNIYGNKNDTSPYNVVLHWNTPELPRELISPYIVSESNGKTIVDLSLVKSDRDDINLAHHSFGWFDLEDDELVFSIDKYRKMYLPQLYHMKFLDTWCNESSCKRVIITHDKCLDGFGVELVALMAAPDTVRDDITIIKLNYNSYNIDDIVKMVEDSIVYVGDFSFELEELEKLKEVCMIQIVDHHEKPFNKATEKYTNCVFDMTKSGAVLTWCYFNYDLDNMPALIELIGDRDVWNWFHDEEYVKATSVFLGSYLSIPDGSKKFINDHSMLFSLDFKQAKQYLDSVLSPFIAAVKADDKRISDAIKNYRIDICKINDVYFLSLNYSDEFTRSELLNKLSTMFNMPAFSWTIKNNILAISLRSTSDDVNVNEIAIPFGGGGHPRASGINIDINDIDLPLFFGMGNNHRELRRKDKS